VNTALFHEPADRAAISVSQDLAQDLLQQGERLRRLARSAADSIVYDELVELACKCDAAAATIINHWHGRTAGLLSSVAATATVAR
jgi:hypothetical protein